MIVSSKHIIITPADIITYAVLLYTNPPARLDILNMNVFQERIYIAFVRFKTQLLDCLEIVLKGIEQLQRFYGDLHETEDLVICKAPEVFLADDGDIFEMMCYAIGYDPPVIFLVFEPASVRLAQ